MGGEEWSQGRASKRRRLDDESFDRPITNAGHLQRLLQFQQDASTSPEPINAFIKFLKSIENNQNNTHKSENLDTLLRYCEEQQAAHDEGVTLPDLISTWSFAFQNGAEDVAAAIVSALAQLLRIASSLIDFRDFGLSLIDTLLRPEQIRLLERSLGAGKAKEFLLLPSIDLLGQLVSFDGGARLPAIWLRKDIFFRRLDAFLDDHTLRPHALPVLDALIRLADSSTTIHRDLLNHGRALQALLKGLPQDPEPEAVTFLDLIGRHLVHEQDTESAQLRFFNPARLGYIAALYKQNDDDDDDDETPLRLAVHSLLLRLCTTRDGILLPHTGWYPPAASAERLLDPEDDIIDLGLEAASMNTTHASSILVRNNTLSLFMHKLRPEDDPLQSDLLLKIFAAAQELVAPYFAKHVQFSVPLEDILRWRAQFACYFSVIHHPIPKHFGWKGGSNMDPPPLTVSIEHILPKPFDAALIKKLLSSDDEVMVISGARLVTVALQKLALVIEQLSAQTTISTMLCSQATDLLLTEFSARIPSFKDFVSLTNSKDDIGAAQRTALLECLATYYQVLPGVAASSAFDISKALTLTITRLENEPVHEDRDELLEQVKHCMNIATTSNSTRWTTKANAETLSPLMRVIRLALTNDSRHGHLNLLKPICDVLLSQGSLSSPRSFEALTASLTKDKKFEPCEDVFLFVDNCVYQAGRKPVHYLDQLEEAQKLVSDKKPLCLIACAISDQWQHTMSKNGDNKDLVKNTSSWITRFFSLLDHAGENYRVMTKYQDSMVEASGKKTKTYFQKSIERTRKSSLVLPLEPVDRAEPNTPGEAENAEGPKSDDLHLVQLFGPLPKSSPSLLGLSKWSSDIDLDSEIKSGRIGRLIDCTSSPEYEIRMQTFQLLQHVAHVIDLSTHESKGQVYLLIGELCETIRQHGLETPLPSFVSELAKSILDVLTDATHKVYGKINKFLLRSPHWEIRRLVSYWIEKIVLTKPESYDDDSWTNEMAWFLNWIIAGLHDTIDLEHYKKSNVIERVLSLYAMPNLLQQQKQLILTLIWRCAGLENGCEMLWTRYGLDSWLNSTILLDRGNENVLRALSRQIKAKVEPEHIAEWKIGRPLPQYFAGSN